jgi:hypothetical protein
MNNEYHKIETLFERDMEGTKKLIIGKFRNKLVEFLQDCEWIFTEKIDGTNVRVHWDGHKVTFHGRTERANLPTKLYENLQELFGGEVNAQMFEQHFGADEVTFIGEGYGAGIQSGGLYREDQSFILFDVRVGEIFLERDNIEGIAKTFGLDIVPVVFRGTLIKAVNLVKTDTKSTVGNAVREGLVGVPSVRCFDIHGNRTIVKIKARDF